VGVTDGAGVVFVLTTPTSVTSKPLYLASVEVALPVII